MIKIYARYKIKRVIRYHEKIRRSLMYARGYPGIDISWDNYVEDQDYLWHLGACEYRCIIRLEKLLNKYSSCK